MPNAEPRELEPGADARSSGYLDLETGIEHVPPDRNLKDRRLTSASIAFRVETVNRKEFCEIELKRNYTGGDLRLMPSLNNVSNIPEERRNLVVVALIRNLLHFRIFDGKGEISVHTDENKIMERVRDSTKPTYVLRLMPLLRSGTIIPKEGKNLVIVAEVKGVLRFRVFDGAGKVVMDQDDERLMLWGQTAGDPEQVRQIEGLRRQLDGLWPPHKLTQDDKVRVITALSLIESQNWKIALEMMRKDLVRLWPPHQLSRAEKDGLIGSVTEILDYSRFYFPPDDKILVTITSRRKDGQADCRDFMKSLELKMKLATKLSDARKLREAKKREEGKAVTTGNNTSQPPGSGKQPSGPPPVPR